ncbi:MAG: tRNA (adenosine(37)-N6)-threonylcarbamoyltransferase complex ATPase subunit type 1 TsaE [Legionellaceae bacterium]|nr:tRNA (adenosine(37)-N6)-threonylcarbamoyltransferase complex ATPase subunit type 1 TsaE [Legionellaceae bacterium]
MLNSESEINSHQDVFLNTRSYHLPDLAATELLAAHWAEQVRAPLVLLFQGPLGAGKTSFIRALLRALGVQGTIKSPTYALVETYPISTEMVFHHFDLYRIQEETELAYIGFDEYFSADAICCVEWPERLEHWNTVDVVFCFSYTEQGRLLEICAKSTLGNAVLAATP